VETVLILLAAWRVLSRTAPIALPPGPAARRTPEYSRLG